VVNPSVGDDGDSLHKRELMAVAAALGVPFHVLTGDVSAANYSSLRAGIVVFYALLDAWLAHAIVPTICEPAFARTMQRAAIELGEPKLEEVTAHWTSPPRPWVDPLKDVTAQIMEIRAGLSNLPKALASRGIDWRREFAEDFQVNKLIDLYGLAFDTDPRRINQMGAIQPSAGWVNPKPGADAQATADEGTDQTDRALRLICASAMAEEEGDAAAAEQLLLRGAAMITQLSRLPQAA
jgi:capsid protein